MADQQQQNEPPANDQVELSADDVFNNTFAELSTTEPTPRVDPAPKEGEVIPPKEGEEPGALPTPEEAAAAEAERVAAEAAAAAGKGKDGGEGDKGQGQQPSIEELLRKALKPDPTEAERQAAAAEAQRQQQEQERARQAAADRNKVPDYTEDQKKIVDTYEREFPEVSAAEEIKRSREYHAVTNYIFGEVGKVLSQQAEVIRQQGAALATLMGHTAQTTIKEQVGDIAPLKPEIEKWIGDQPKFLQDTYKRVMAEGTADEVVGLVNHYRAVTGAKAPDPKTPPAPTPPAGGGGAATKVDPPRTVPPVPTPTPRVPAGLRPVASSRSTVPEGGVPRDDFEGAFETFAAAATAR